MNLQALIGSTAPDIEVTGIEEDSRLVGEGDVFVALRGSNHDGTAFIGDACARGAAAVLIEAPLQQVTPAPPEGAPAVPTIVIPDLARRRSELAAAMYGEPGRSVRCLGVTGTNGKTSICHHTAHMLQALGEPCGYMGTLGWGPIAELSGSAMTTAGAVATQQRLAALKAAGCRWAAMEVSSHALDQGRVEAVPFEAAVFANLTRDHLDYHGTMADYGAAKRKLFEMSGLALGVVNADDAFGAKLAADFARRYQMVSFGRAGDVSWQAVRYHQGGVSGVWRTPWGNEPFELPLIGEFSVANAAAALALLCGLGFSLPKVVQAQAELPGVPGRMEFIPLRSGPAAVIDYAHTPDALASVLPALRNHCRGELICVFGCGGDRDPGKRPLMAAVAEQAADVLWLTSDNPRSEDPEQILGDMRSGLSGDACVFECVDRAEAIERALACAGDEDVVLVAGKGHEDYQELAEGRVPFSDRAVIVQLGRERAG